MSKHLLTLATLALLSGPALADNNHDFIDSCESNKYECDQSFTFKGKYRSTAPLSLERPAIDDREERRKQENNTRAN